jgi:hypothetical protein
MDLECVFETIEKHFGRCFARLHDDDDDDDDIILTEDAPIYRTFPLSTTSFSARIISSRGVCLSSLCICNTSIYVPSRLTLSSTASKMCLRDKPMRFTKAPSFVLTAEMGSCSVPSFTPK